MLKRSSETPTMIVYADFGEMAPTHRHLTTPDLSCADPESFVRVFSKFDNVF